MVRGTVAPGYEPVRAAFERCFDELGETGAQVAAFVDGRQVADLWGGEGVRARLAGARLLRDQGRRVVLRARARRSRPPAASTTPWSSTGRSSAPPASRTSRCGSCSPTRRAWWRCAEERPPELLLDWDATCAALAAEAPWWEPGTGHAEHALFYGHLCGELVRRVDGRTLGTFWRDEVAGPWRLDVHLGLGDDELARTLDLAGAFSPPRDELNRLALGNPPGARDLAVVNGEAWRRAEIPAVNGHATAMGIARLYAGLVAGGELDGVRLVSPETVAAMRAGERTDHDVLLGEDVTWGLGVWVDHDGFGMAGIGGSLGMADPDTGLAEAYVTRQMGGHDRCGLVDEALRAALAAG